MDKQMTFKTIIEQDEDGVFLASVPAIPGCHAEGETYEEVLKNIREVIELCLEEAEVNSWYRDKIDFSTEESKNSFLGVVSLKINS